MESGRLLKKGCRNIILRLDESRIFREPHLLRSVRMGAKKTGGERAKSEAPSTDGGRLLDLVSSAFSAARCA
jgi:hypothetical protein